jgi:hypothetical protein
MTKEMIDQSEERKKLYASTRQDLLTRNLSNSEKYDNAILTLSTGVLGLSLAFIKDIVPLEKVQCVILLISSWCLFGLSIASTLSSFVLSQRAIKCQLDYAEKYYLEKKDEYENKNNRLASWTEYINYLSGILFILGIIATITFVSLNIKGGNIMTKDMRHSTTDGASVLNLQKIQTGEGERGAPVPSLQPVTPSSSDSSSQHTSSQGSPSSENSGESKK